MNAKGKNPFQDLALVVRFYRLLRRERPIAFLAFTAKPNIYGSIASHFLKIPVINNVAGLGEVFISKGWLSLVVCRLYRLAFSRSAKVFFQNTEDLNLFVKDGVVRKELCQRLPGSGVDLKKFVPAEGSPLSQGFSFLLVARLLWEKGVGDYASAAKIVRRKNADAKFYLLGIFDEERASGISREKINEWSRDCGIVFLGATSNVHAQIVKSDCVVLPTYYREGVPRSLLEAAATGKPVITTDLPGCRDAVDHGITGYTCCPRDPADLAKKMLDIMEISSGERARMGRAARRKMEREFDEEIVLKGYLCAVSEATQA